MAIEFHCTQCNTILRVDEEHLGKKARCPQCQMIMSVPDGKRSEAPSYEAETIYQSDEGQSSLKWLMQTADKSVYGPARYHELEQWVAEGRVSSECYLQRVGQEKWIPAVEIFPMLAEANVVHDHSWSQPANPPGQRENPAPNVQFNQPFPRGQVQRSHNGPVIIILAMVGVFILPCAIIAWIISEQELKGIYRGTVDPAGESMIKFGRILAILFTVLGALSFFGFCCCLPQINLIG